MGAQFLFVLFVILSLMVLSFILGMTVGRAIYRAPKSRRDPQ